MKKYNLLDRQDMAQLRADARAELAEGDLLLTGRSPLRGLAACTGVASGKSLCPPSTPSFTRVKLGELYGITIEAVVKEGMDPRWLEAAKHWFAEAQISGL